MFNISRLNVGVPSLIRTISPGVRTLERKTLVELVRHTSSFIFLFYLI
jgi:hypothetical protein